MAVLLTAANFDLRPKGITPKDVMMWQLQQKHAKRVEDDKRIYEQLKTVYDTSMKVNITDWGPYSDEVIGSYNEAVKKATADIKAGKSAASTVGYYDGFVSNQNKARQLIQDEKTYAAYVNASKLLTPAGMQKAITDRAATVFTDENGNERSLEEAAKISKSLNIDVSKYIDTQTVYKDFRDDSQQYGYAIPGPNGSSVTVTAYEWQDVNKETGQVEIKLEDYNGEQVVPVGVYNSFMSSEARAGKASYDAEKWKREQEAKGEEVNEADLDLEKRKIVTNIITSMGKTGYKTSYHRGVYYRPKSGGTLKSTDPAFYYDSITNLEEKEIPDENDPSVERISMYTEDGQPVYGRNITGDVKAIDTHIQTAYITTDGAVVVNYSGSKKIGGIPQYQKFDTMDDFLSGNGNRYATTAYEQMHKNDNAGDNTTTGGASNGTTGGATTTQAEPDVITEPKDYEGKQTKYGVVESVTESNGVYYVKFAGSDATKQYGSKEDLLNSLKVEDETGNNKKPPPVID